MPLPTLLCLGFASGIAASLAGRSELRVSPRPPVLTRSFAAFLAFASFVLVPVTVYFYVFHGDWFLLYLIDVRRVPSAIALVGFIVEVGVGAGGFALGAALIRGQREASAVGLAVLALAAGIAVVFIARERLSLVGTYAQYVGGFGLEPYGSGALVQGTVAMSAVLTIGLAYLLLRLQWSGRRG